MIQVNDSHGSSDHFGTAELNADIERLEEKHGIFCFYYGPPLWMFGKPCDENGAVDWSVADFDYMIDHCSQIALTAKNTLYRVQLDLQESEISPQRFCSPPDEYRKKYWRFDNKTVQVCYASFDIETCLHESRVSLQNEIYVVTMKPKRELRLLDMTNFNGPAGVTRFEDPAIWLRALLYDGEQSYDICRRLAGRIQERGYDGFVYTSFFQQAAERPHKNVAIFGTPIKSGNLMVASINQVKVLNMAYDWQFGPVVLGAYLDDEANPAEP